MRATPNSQICILRRQPSPIINSLRQPLQYTVDQNRILRWQPLPIINSLRQPLQYTEDQYRILRRQL
jgi:hypothetical protein